MMSAWPVGLMLAFAHGSILTLASEQQRLRISKLSDRYVQLLNGMGVWLYAYTQNLK
jgi:hypothetical protein